MRSKIFYTAVILLYLSSSYFIYTYTSLQPAKDDLAKIKSGITTNSETMDTSVLLQKEVIEQEENDLTLESYGYLGGAAFVITFPTLLLVFRRRFLN